jgi:type VI secretion system protein ImpM
MVLPFKRMDNAIPASYALYGKLPNRADFVRVNANHAIVVEFDGLLQRALERLAQDKHWAASYATARPVEFQYVSRDSRYALIGALAPSSDLAGRKFPLLAAVIVPAEAVAYHAPIAPIAYEVFFDGLREHIATALSNSVEALSCREFLQSQVRGDEAAAADLELARSVVERFMQTTSIGRLRDILQSGSRPLELEQTLLNIAFYRAFLRRFGNPSTNQIIRLPLPADQGEQTLVASAWLSLLNALGRSAGNESPACKNFLILNDGAGASLAACYAEAHERLVMQMLGAAGESTLLDLHTEQEAWKSHRLYAEVSYALGRLLADPALKLDVLCRFLGEVSVKLELAI